LNLDRGDSLLTNGKQNGVFEIEFQNAEDRTLTVTQNTNPASAPAGFLPLEAVSFVVNLAEGADGLGLQQIDYILNAGSTCILIAGR
jgi:hypothetical protein